MAQSKKILNTLFFLFFTFSFFSCDPAEVIEQLQDEEIAEIIEAALQGSTGGMTDMLSDFSGSLMNAVENVDPAELCDSIFQTTKTIDQSSVRGEADYIIDWIYEFNCNVVNVPQDAIATLISDGSSSTPRVNSVDSSTLMIDVDGLALLESDIVIDGTYSRDATLDYASVANQTTNVISTLAMTFTSLMIAKNGFDIISGSANFTYNGTENGASFTHTGSISFLGNQQATVTLNGVSYSIDLT